MDIPRTSDHPITRESRSLMALALAGKLVLDLTGCSGRDIAKEITDGGSEATSSSTSSTTDNSGTLGATTDDMPGTTEPEPLTCPEPSCGCMTCQEFLNQNPELAEDLRCDDPDKVLDKEGFEALVWEAYGGGYDNCVDYEGDKSAPITPTKRFGILLGLAESNEPFAASFGDRVAAWNVLPGDVPLDNCDGDLNVVAEAVKKMSLAGYNALVSDGEAAALSPGTGKQRLDKIFACGPFGEFKGQITHMYFNVSGNCDRDNAEAPPIAELQLANMDDQAISDVGFLDQPSMFEPNAKQTTVKLAEPITGPGYYQVATRLHPNSPEQGVFCGYAIGLKNGPAVAGWGGYMPNELISACITSDSACFQSDRPGSLLPNQVSTAIGTSSKFKAFE